MEMDHRDSDLEGSVSNAELSDTDMEEESARRSAPGVAPYKPDDVPTIKEEGVKGGEGSGFSLPVGFPFPHPGAFLPPPPFQPPLPPTPHVTSPLSSESSGSSSQQQTWSFEEQFKQVRQLYEISDDPKRKEFLDDLFNFMQRRGTPINRLPIMAKSVLDLYELYNLVIQRGGLVDVINKKLWQEIIKGLHLPSSITSAAFTLRTQYMKYLYPYECEKRRLSTPGELQAAIDGNRREGRRGSYGTYAEMMQRSPTQGGQATPLSLVTGRPSVNGSHNHALNNNHLPPHQSLLPPSIAGGYIGAAGLAPAEFEVRMAEYVKLLNKELSAPSSNPPVSRQASPPMSPAESIISSGTPGTHPITPLEMTKLSLWGFYGAGAYSPEQKEALNLEKREDHIPPPPPKRPHTDSDEIHMTGAHIKIATRGDGRGGTDNSSLVVSIDLNGIMYQGVLFAQAPKNSRIMS